MFSGDHIMHHDLAYAPDWPKAITACGSHHVIISEHSNPPVLHVHSLDGEEVARIDHHRLGLGDVWLHGIRCTTESTLHMVTGAFRSITAIHAYQVCITCS